MVRKAAIINLALCLLLTGCIHEESIEQKSEEVISVSDESVLLSVDGEPIHTGELEDSYAVDSDTMTMEDSFAQTIEFIDATLIFNESVTVIAADISYFDPDDARTEKWNLEQATEYLGISFIPSYMPEDLELIEDYSADSFFLENIDGILYWTVAYEEDTDVLVYDNFGLFYSDTSIGEYNPSQRSLRIEVSKEDIPLTDCFYMYDTTEVSTIGSTELTIGSYYESYSDEQTYIAEFMVEDVGYRILSINLSQEEFVKVLISLPVFQK